MCSQTSRRRLVYSFNQPTLWKITKDEERNKKSSTQQQQKGSGFGGGGGVGGYRHTAQRQYFLFGKLKVINKLQGT